MLKKFSCFPDHSSSVPTDAVAVTSAFCSVAKTLNRNNIREEGFILAHGFLDFQSITLESLVSNICQYKVYGQCAEAGNRRWDIGRKRGFWEMVRGLEEICLGEKIINRSQRGTQERTKERFTWEC